MRSFICVFSLLLHSLSAGLWWCIAFSYGQVASSCTSPLYIKVYITFFSVHIYIFILIFEANLKKDTSAEFCISFCNKPCCRRAEFLPCLVWPGTPQFEFWSLWSSQNLSYVQNFHRGVQSKGYFSFCPPFLVPSMYSLLPDCVSQNLCKTRNQINVGHVGGKLLKIMSDGSHELKKNCYNFVV